MLDPAARKRLIQLLAMGSSDHPGEAGNALRAADRLVRGLGMSWEEVLDPSDVETEHQLQVATDACRELQDEVERLQFLLARAAKAAVNGMTLVGDHNKQARWILDLHEAGRITLRHRDVEFLQTVSHWRLPSLTDRQRPWFASLLDRVRRATGESPP